MSQDEDVRGRMDCVSRGPDSSGVWSTQAHVLQSTARFKQACPGQVWDVQKSAQVSQLIDGALPDIERGGLGWKGLDQGSRQAN